MSFTYLADYDDLASIKNGDEIIWMRKRIDLIFFSPIKRFIKSDNTDLAIGVMTLICCAIEALGHFRSGRTSNGGSEKDFKLFIKEYIPKASRISSTLYAYFRCGLAHAFVIERGGIEGEIPNLFKKEKRRKVFYEINPWILFDLLEKGTNNYFKDLESKKTLKKNFRKRFEFSFKFWLENPPTRGS